MLKIKKNLPEDLIVENFDKILKNHITELNQIYVYYETNPYRTQCKGLTPIYPLESIDKIEEILM